MPNGMDYSLLQRVIDGTGMILDTEPGTPDDVGTYVTENQLADWIKGKILFTGYYHNGNFYSDSGHTTLLAKVNGALYIDQTNANKALYVCLSSTYQSLTEEAQVQAIIDGLNDGTIVPLKAKQDQNGNVIDQTYETKAEASDLKDAIQANSQRIENLEVAVSGELVQTNTDATQANTKVITSANEILPWAILKRVGARAVSWNQLIINNSFGNTDNWQTGWGLTVVNNILTATITNGGQYGNLSTTGNTIKAGHTYLYRIRIKNNTNHSLRLKLFNTSVDLGGQDVAVSTEFKVYTGKTTLPTDATQTGTLGLILQTLYGGLDGTVEISDAMLCDLTEMSVSTMTKDEFNAIFIGHNYAHDEGSIIPLNPSAFKVVGKQKWDEQWKNGYINSSGSIVSDSRFLASKNPIDVIEGETYYFLLHASIDLKKVNADGTVTSVGTISNGGTYTVPTGVHQLVFNSAVASAWTTYANDSMICLNSVTDKTYEEYKETTIDTSDVPEGYVDSEHYNYKENVLVDGVIRGAIHDNVIRKAILDGTTGSWGFEDHSADGYYAAYKNNDGTEAFLPNYYKPSSNSELPIQADGAIATTRSDVFKVGSVPNVAIQQKPSSYLIFGIPTSLGITSSSAFNTWLQTHNVTIYYRTTEESQTITYTEPIPNFPCEDGTTITAITPQTDLVNRIDVPSTIAYMTRISS